jgi:hypothetical protein
MVPQGYAAPNAALNSTINRGNALTKKLALLGIFVTRLDINPVVPDAPTRGVSIPDAEALGIVPDDLVHLLFEYAGGEGNQAEVAVIEKLIAPCTVSGVLAVFSGLFPSLTASQTESRALTALANLPAVAAALQTALA